MQADPSTSPPPIEDFELARLKAAGILFEPPKITSVLSNLSEKEAAFVALYTAAHAVISSTKDDPVWFSEAFMLNFLMYKVSINGVSRQEAINIFKAPPVYHNLLNKEQNEEENKNKTLFDKMIGK